MDAGLTWGQAMAWTHHDPAGFSANHAADEHFATSIDIGDHIARVVRDRCLAAARRHGIQRPWIVDVGAGSGRLLRQLLDLGFPRDRLLGVDVRPPPADLPVAWVQGVAPECVPTMAGLLFAHEFLDDIPADRVRDGRVVTVDGLPGPPATQADLDWQARWGGPVVGRRRDDAWARLVGSLSVGEAIAVDFAPTGPLGYRAGRRTPPVADGLTDVCAGVELRSARRRTGGRIIPQHRMLAGLSASTAAHRGELAVLRDKAGLGAFGWLITDVARIGSPA